MITGTAPPRATVSEAVERGAQALYEAAMPRGATPWQRHSHAFQGIYLERSGIVLAAAIDVEELARVLGGHAVAPRTGAHYRCTCGVYLAAAKWAAVEYLPEHQAEAIRTRLLGGAA
jgi:hypothetical protein